MSNLIRRNVISWAFMGLPLVVAGLVGGWNAWDNQARTRAEMVVPARDLPELVDLLRAHGMDLRVVPVRERGEVTQSAYLTTTEAGWQHFNALPRNPQQIDRWQGCVYGERILDPDERYFRASERADCCLQQGQFVFFGDPALLNEIRQVLRVRGA
jgi:hypothetical protein